MIRSSASPKAVRAEATFSDWERVIEAFVTLADNPACAAETGALAGRTVAVKDVIDVAGLPTRNGSHACAEAPPADTDATVVARLRAAGARIVGKTVTTEFAFTDPTSCRNPYGRDRSPGGSSSGSGAAVGAGLVDMALGTQTAGSLIRPAAYCGAVGFKPGRGVLPMQGVTPLSPSHDMVGIIARDMPLVRAAFAAMLGAPLPEAVPLRRAGVLMLDTQTPVDPARLAALEDASARVAARLGPPQEMQPVADIARIVADHRTVMCAEAAAVHGRLLEGTTRALLMPRFREALLAGRATDPQQMAAAARRLSEARAAFWAAHDVDVIVTLPVPEGPPRLGDSTGFQHWLTVWTVLGGPLLCLPWGLDPEGLPLSILLAGRPGSETALLRFGQDMAATAPPMPRPALPAG